ncbi:T9SS type A sorting domain-containing protein [Flavobacterium sp. AJR]|uniref:T9SS type A sorting domain-containing protein n=1 Tax=Flavobacterium sp. AJR TaxID=1979369 RepID=UPI002101C30D|nr:T9SS type A sorting domain-containing protein [Flavobacterium sp. AJR]
MNWIKITKSGSTTKAVSLNSEIEETDSLIVYPSPVENTLFFTTDVTGINVSIVDSQTGAAISGQKIINNSLDVSSLKAGVYLIVLDKDGTKTVKRFIKK